MNPQTPTGEYLLLIRGTHWSHGMSPAELQKVMVDFYSWVDDLSQRGVHRGAQPLMEEGKIVTGGKNGAVTDGVFAESKEAIGGYFLLAVANIEEAVALAQACPIVACGAQIEVRPVADVCPVMPRMDSELNLTAAL
ncbi:MAG: YciI family protein [Chthoniobacterales bacterium]